ncbi:MAG: hypothetical protein ABSA76_06130 [Bacteroidales bacterium]
MRNKLIIGAILIVVAGFWSCQKSDRLSNSPSLATTLTASVAEVVGNQVSNITGATEHCLSLETFNGLGDAHVLGDFNIGNNGMPNFGPAGIGHFKFSIPRIDSCATVTVSSETYPKEIIIVYDGTCSASSEGRDNFGPECGPEHAYEHGHVIQGKIIIDISDSLNLAGSTENVVFQNFYMDSMKIDLNAKYTNLGQNSSGNWVLKTQYNQTITKNDLVVVRENNETQEWITGFETRDRSDNKYYVSGSGSVSINDTTYTKTITTPLLFDAGCDYISSGVVELAKNGSTTATIDYGDGTCDDTATVTINGTSETISLHSYKFPGGGHFEKHFHGFGKKG